MWVVQYARNVLEWCWDRGGDYPNSAQTNTTGPDSGKTDRIYRGGNFDNEVRNARSALRDSTIPLAGEYSVGFRVARP